MYVQLKSLTKNFGDVTAVSDVTLSVERGEFFTLLGPSGSGKTTVLRMIAGFVSPTTGHIQIDGMNIEGVPAHERNLGMVFQDYSLFPHLTVYENVSFGLRMRGMPRQQIDEKVHAILEIVKLGGLESRSPEQLSGGQQQRVALARALVIEPLVLLLDEPLGALDRKLREQMQIELRRLHDELGVTTIFVTHDQDEALSLSDRIAILHQGSVEQAGAPLEIYERPANAFVADFLGKANLFKVELISESQGESEVELESGLKVTFPRILGADIGERFRLLVRPERINCSFRGEEATGPCVACSVVRTIYQGTGLYMLLEGSGGLLLTAYLPAKELDEDQMASINSGQRVWVSWSSESATVIRETG